MNNMNSEAANSRNGFQAEQKDIRFDPATEREALTKKRVEEVEKPKKARWYFLIPGILLLIISLLFIGWYIKPKRVLNVCLLDKTLLTVEEGNEINPDALYRKHQGFFWLLEQGRYVFEDGSYYRYKQDYFGPILNAEGLIETKRELSSLDYTPDLMYIADVYGAVDDTYGYYDQNSAKDGGISVDDMSVISYAYENGATVIAEMELFNSNIQSSVYSQLTGLCGVKPTGWVGRYIYDLQDFSDVPDWAPPMYEKQEGVEWQFEGPGILLVSDTKIIILEQKTDFNSKDLLQIYINGDYEEEFDGCRRLNFYNWFEIIEPSYGSEVLASFELDVNATGMEKLKGVLTSPRFVAMTRKQEKNKAPVYYFAGDFNDYVNHENYNRFIHADTVYRWLSYDIAGDISHFYWEFYNPLMKKILADIQHNGGNTAANGAEDVRVTENAFEIFQGDQSKHLKPKVISLNAAEPGKETYSKNYTFYEELIKTAVALNVDTIYAKDILPPEFYRALYANNSKYVDDPLYLIQRIAAPEAYTEEAWKEKLTQAVHALHGEGKVSASATLDEASYFIDVSGYVLGFVIDEIRAEPDYHYEGTYTRGTGVVGFGAFLYDTLQTASVEHYGRHVAIGLGIEADQLAGSGLEQATAYSFNGMFQDQLCGNFYFFTSISIDSVTQLLQQCADRLHVSEEPYSAVLRHLQEAARNRLLITHISYSSNVGIYGSAATTEKEQGQQLVEMLEKVYAADVIGGVVFDLNDDWSAVSEDMYPFTVPSGNNYLWHNVADPAQTTGIVAVETVTPKESGINISDDDRVQMLSLSANEGYFYITLQLLDDIDHATEKFFIGIDTYQRNDGEYYYSKEYTPTALSGMEFVIGFDSKQEATLYVTKAYDRASGSYATQESYTGEYSPVAQLSYGGFSNGDNQFYQTGSTIYIRLPWNWLNVTDPSSKIVLDNAGQLGEQAKTVSTNGAIVSVLIADQTTKDQLYMFPEKKQDPSYKTFKWHTWEASSYNLRPKEGYALLQKFYESI